MDTGICMKECPDQGKKAKDLVSITYKGDDGILDDISFDYYNDLGTYKSKKFAPLKMCMPDIDDLADTHPN